MQHKIIMSGWDDKFTICVYNYFFPKIPRPVTSYQMRKVPLATALIFAVFCANTQADTVTLMSGEKLQGKIVSETSADVTIDVKVSAAISDERVIKRDEIKTIEKASQDDLDFEKIKGLKPDPLFADKAVVEQSINRLKAFQAQYPQSPHSGAVKSVLDDFQKEQDHLAAGEVKYYGTWLSKSEAGKHKGQLNAVALFSSMKKKAAEGELVGALNTFDQLEKVGVGSRAYPAAVVYATQLISALSQQVARYQDKLKYDNTQWEQNVAITAEPQKSQIIAARNAEIEKYNSILDATQKSGVKWPPLIAASQKSLEAVAGAASSETTRLSSVPVDKMNASLQKTDKAAKAFASKDYATADSLLKEATTLWSQNDDAIYLASQVADAKAAEAKRAEAAAKATPTPKPTATPAPSVAAQPASTPASAAQEPKPSPLAFFMTVPGALCIVGGAILLLLLVAGLQKLKKPKAEQV